MARKAASPTASGAGGRRRTFAFGWFTNAPDANSRHRAVAMKGAAVTAAAAPRPLPASATRLPRPFWTHFPVMNDSVFFGAKASPATRATSGGCVGHAPTRTAQVAPPWRNAWCATKRNERTVLPWAAGQFDARAADFKHVPSGMCPGRRTGQAAYRLARSPAVAGGRVRRCWNLSRSHRCLEDCSKLGRPPPGSCACQARACARAGAQGRGRGKRSPRSGGDKRSLVAFA
jgi:hypothetical protein